MTISILTVCLGNICRSPTAEAALRQAAAEAGVDLEVRSAGTGSWHVGSPPDHRMRAAAAAVELHLEGEAARVTADDLRDADLVLAMDAANLDDLQRLAAAHDITTPIRRFRVFDPEGPGDLDVPDPYYGGEDGFRAVVEMCRRTADALIAQLADGVPVAGLTQHTDPLAP
jgi:protein-tyrosine phosphatase